jgi:hypothetical protein
LEREAQIAYQRMIKLLEHVALPHDVARGFHTNAFFLVDVFQREKLLAVATLNDANLVGVYMVAMEA